MKEEKKREIVNIGKKGRENEKEEEEEEEILN